MKKLLYGVLVILGVCLLLFLMLELFFFRNYKDYPPELTDFKPSEFSIDAGKPFFYKIDDGLYYSNDGVLNLNSKPIWNGEMNEYSFVCQASPDNQYIAFVRGETEILILRKDGKVVSRISPIAKSFIAETRKSGDYNGEFFQWSSDSKKLFLLRDTEWKMAESIENKSSIVQYSINDDTLTELVNLEEECRELFFFDSEYNNLYYQVVEGGEFHFNKIQIVNQGEGIEKHGEPVSTISEPVFINYFNVQFGDWDSKGENLFVEGGSGYTSGFYFHHGSSNQAVFYAKRGYDAFKGGSWGFNGGGSGFLPNNKFFYTGSVAKDFEGTIFIEVESLRYTFKKINFECFYSITNMDYPDFILGYDHLKPKLKSQTSIENSIR